MDKKDKILTIIPSYNEEKTIANVIEQIKRVLPDTDILVVNDGSSDNTLEIAKECGVKIISLPHNMGYGISLQTGFKFAYKYDYDYVIQMDGDGQHDPDSMLALLDEIRKNEADVVVGSRFRGEGDFKPPLLRRLGILFFSAIASLILRTKITDPTSGFQALNHHGIRFNASDYYPVDFPDADFIVMLHRAGLVVHEIPVKMHPSPPGRVTMHSGLRPVYYIFNMMLSLLVVMLRKHDFKREQ